MSVNAVAFFDRIKEYCIAQGNEGLWSLAATHPSAQTHSAQIALARLGKAGLELILVWHHIRSRVIRDVGTVTKHMSVFGSSSIWVDALISIDTMPIFTKGKGLQLETLSLPVKRQFITAALGACFYLNAVEASHIVQEFLVQYYYDVGNTTIDNTKSILQAYSQRMKLKLPEYSVVSEEGPEHNKQFLVKVVIPGTGHSAQGQGGTKKLGEIEAAANLLPVLGLKRRNELAKQQPAFASSRLTHVSISLPSADLAKWTREQAKNETLRLIRRKAIHCAQSFREQTGIHLFPELVAVAITHSSLNSMGPYDSGFSMLGNYAYNYALTVASIRSQPVSRLNNLELDSRIKGLVSTLGTNRYKARLAEAWATYICTAPNVPRPVPESVLLDAYEGIIGAAVLSDLGNIASIESHLRDQLISDVDFTKVSVLAELAREYRNIARSQLQQLHQLCFPAKPLIFEALLAFEATGPEHNQLFICKFIGDKTQLLCGSAPTKSAAIKTACDKALAWVCSHVVGEDVLCGNAWIDSIVQLLRSNLLNTPCEAWWLALRFELLPFTHGELWEAVGTAVRTPNKATLSNVLRDVQINPCLTPKQRESLSAFLAERLRDSIAAHAIDSVQVAFHDLIERQQDVSPQLAIRTVCSALHLLKTNTWHKPRWVTATDLVRDALAILYPCSTKPVTAPTNLAVIEYEAFLSILHQLRSGDCLLNEPYVSIEKQPTVMLISCAANRHGLREQRELLIETWSICDMDRCGFTVNAADDSIIIRIPLATEVLVTNEGIYKGGAAHSSSEIIFTDEIFPDIDSVCTALHEIKNRIIACPELWQTELSECAINLRKVAQVMRAPQPVRTRLQDIRKLLDDAAMNAGTVYHTFGSVNVIEDDGVGYVDVEMVQTILRNLTDNAAKATAETSEGTWGIEGYIDTSTIEITVFNSCKNVEAARQTIETGVGRSANTSGTGIGIATIKRLVGKLMGLVAYSFEDGNVKSRVVIPIDAATVVWIGGEGM